MFCLNHGIDENGRDVLIVEAMASPLLDFDLEQPVIWSQNVQLEEGGETSMSLDINVQRRLASLVARR